MKRKFNIAQTVAVVLTVVGILGAYFFGQTLPKQQAEVGVDSTNHATHQSPPIDVDAYISSAMDKLDGDEQLTWQKLNKTDNFTEQVAFWRSIDRNDVASFYQQKLAEQTDNAEEWNLTGNLFVRAFRETADTSAISYFINQAVVAYEHALAKDNSQVETKLKLAKIYTDVTGDVMSGVFKLQEIVEQDPNHVQANYELGLLAMRSGQNDKAIERFTTINKVKPNFIEPYLLKAQLLIEHSNKQEALSTIDDAIKNANNAKEVDALNAIRNNIVNN